MKEKYKQILKIWLIVFAVATLFKIVNTIDGSFLKSVFVLGFAPIEITSLILFVFVGNRGEEKIARYGIISILVYFVLYALYKWSVYDLTVLTSGSFMDKLLTAIYYASGSCITIFEYLAIFSFIKNYNDKIEKLKMGALICIISYTVLTFIAYLFISDSILLSDIRSCVGYVGALAKYAAIIFCLIDDNYVSKIFSSNNNEEKNDYSQPMDQETSMDLDSMNMHKEHHSEPDPFKVHVREEKHSDPDPFKVNVHEEKYSEPDPFKVNTQEENHFEEDPFKNNISEEKHAKVDPFEVSIHEDYHSQVNPFDMPKQSKNKFVVDIPGDIESAEDNLSDDSKKNEYINPFGMNESKGDGSNQDPTGFNNPF